MTTAVAPAQTHRFRIVLGAVAWQPSGELDLAEWVEHGRRIGGAGRSCGWWIGDWLRYGNERFGERYSRAANATGYDIQTLMNMVYVASHVAVSRRRETLSWSHHAELASLTVDEQDSWLERAAESRWSVRDMRTEIRNARHVQGVEGPIAAAHLDGSALAGPGMIERGEADDVSRDAGPPTNETAADETPHAIVCPRCGYAIPPQGA
jgi:hypothetical protein